MKGDEDCQQIFGSQEDSGLVVTDSSRAEKAKM